MKCSFGISDFLEEIPSLSHSVVFLYFFGLITEEAEVERFYEDLQDQIEENNRIGKTRDHFKKIRDTKGTFHAKMSSIKDRNRMDLTEAEYIISFRAWIADLHVKQIKHGPQKQ